MWIKCLKVKYSKVEAQTVLNKLLRHDRRSRERDKQRKEQRIYHCPLCNAYHLTSKDFDDYSDLSVIINKEEFYQKLKEKIETNE